MKEQYVLIIKADNRPGLLHLVTGMINRRLIEIESSSAAKTDLKDVVLINIELLVTEKALTPLLLKLENIIEVFAVKAIKAEAAVSRRMAYFRVSRQFLDTPAVNLLQKQGTTIINLHPDNLVISKTGTDAEISYLYNQLDGPHLLGFCQSGLIVDCTLIENTDEGRISRLAA